ncbi:retrovirus-related pol polyprotein from transposon TNT 1-94 [Tanacetum coccineum]|uniref:Retrovirus-related pol polyprotein from transposon TNT 1-94 n=1 Tax=Tanacetum coccineum TaxID=301880 RepID=A0ABQ5J6V1_9ASTR
MALMAFSDSEVYNDKTCSKTCLKNYETLKKQCDDLIVKLNQTEFTAATYKRGLATVEEQLITYRKNEVLFSEEVAVLKREVACKDYEINVLKSEFEKVKQEKEGIEFKIEKFDKASKDLDKLLGSQITDKNPEFKSYGSDDSKHESNINKYQKIQVSCVRSPLNVDKETVFLVDKKKEFSKSKNHEKPVKKSVRYAEMYRSQSPRGNQRNWNNLKSQQLGMPQHDDKGFVDSGCSRHMTGNIAYLSDFKQFDGGYVAFGGDAYGGKISSKGTLKTANLDFEDVYFVNELKFNLFSVSQMCDKKNYVLFTDTECLVLSLNFKLPDENQILLKVPRKDNMYSFDMKNIVPKESLTCLVAKATLDESMLWHRRLGKHHRTSYKSKVLNPITKPLFMLHMDLFGPTFVSSLMHKKEKGIKREYSVARTPQQNGVAERRNRTLIEAARTMLADSKLPTTFWAEAVSTACYVHNRVLVVKPHNKTPYELFRGFKPALSFMRPFGCHVTILNTLDSLGKFDGKSDEGFFVGYSLSSKAFRVYNTRTKRVEENLHIGFLENKPMIEGIGPKWLFDIDSLTQSMNYVPVTADTSYFDLPTKDVDNGEPKTFDDAQKAVEDGLNNENAEQERFAMIAVLKSTTSPNKEDNTEEELEVDLGNITNSYIVPNTPNTRIHKDHPIDNVIDELAVKLLNHQHAKALSDSYLVEAMAGRTSSIQANFNKFGYRDSPFELVAYTDNDYAEQLKIGSLQLGLSVFGKQVDIMAVNWVIEWKGLPLLLLAKKQSRTVGDVNAQARFEITSKQSIDPHLLRGYTLRSGEDSMKFIGIDGIFPKFAKTHNVVAFLEKPEESDGFAEIIDFLKASSVSYALTVNPVIYTSCIEQFWATAKVQTVNGVRQLQALVDKKRVIVTESTLERFLLDDAEAKVPQDKGDHEESVPTPSNDPQPSGEDSMQLTDLMVLCTKLQTQVLDLQTAKDAQAKKIAALKKRIQRSEVIGEKKEEQSTKSLRKVIAGEAVTTASVDDSVVPTTNEEITLAQTLIQIKAAKPKVVTTIDPTFTSKDKGKGIMIKPEVPLKRKDQIALDEQIARDIQAKLDAELLEEQKLARKQEEEANIALIEEELIDEEKAKLFMELMRKRRKHFATLRAQEKRNRPPTKEQKITQMSIYLKHMGGYTYKQLKGKSFDEIQKLFDKEMKRVNIFVAMGSEVQESKEKKVEGREETTKGSRKKMLGRKRVGKEQQKESSKK